jgi:hypothetical protein
VRTKFWLHAAVLAVVVLGALISSTAVATASGKHHGTLRIAATENQSEFLDLGTAGPSLGDELVFSEKLFIHGRDVGESGVVCTITEIVAPYDVLRFHCVATLSLRRGQITLQGLIEVQGEDDPGPFTVAITGGTGAFRGAGGEAVVRDVSPDLTVYKLRFDSRKGHHSSRKHRGSHH